MDGDLGPYDVLDVRLQAADTVVFLDFSPARCAWRVLAGGKRVTEGRACPCDAGRGGRRPPVAEARRAAPG